VKNDVYLRRPTLFLHERCEKVREANALVLLGGLAPNKRRVKFLGCVSMIKAAPLDGDRRLICCFLTDDEYSCALGRVEVEGDDLDYFFTKLGVERGHQLIHTACSRSHPR